MKQWYVAYTQPKAEAKAKVNLEQQGFNVYLPCLHATRRHARRVTTVIRPFFPNYLFVSIDPRFDRWRSVNGTYGVRHLITQGTQPLPVPEGIVESIQSMEDQAGYISLHPPAFTLGQTLEIREGPMALHVGVFQRMSEKERVVLLIELLGRQVSVKVPYTDVVAA